MIKADRSVSLDSFLTAFRMIGRIALSKLNAFFALVSVIRGLMIGMSSRKSVKDPIVGAQRIHQRAVRSCIIPHCRLIQLLERPGQDLIRWQRPSAVEVVQHLGELAHPQRAP